MKNNKFITVGIPTYNSSKYIDQCLKSITNTIFMRVIAARPIEIYGVFISTPDTPESPSPKVIAANKSIIIAL